MVTVNVDSILGPRASSPPARCAAVAIAYDRPSLAHPSPHPSLRGDSWFPHSRGDEDALVMDNALWSRSAHRSRGCPHSMTRTPPRLRGEKNEESREMSLRRNGRIDCQDCLDHIKRRFPPEISSWLMSPIFVAFRCDRSSPWQTSFAVPPLFRGKTWEVSCLRP